MKIISKILFSSRIFLIILTIGFVYLSYIIKNDSTYSREKIIIGIIMLLGTIIIPLILKRNFQLSDKLLKETGNLEKYVEIQKGLLNERLIFKNLYQIRMAVVEYYYGYFEESINLFNFVKKFPEKTILTRCYYQALNSLFMNNLDQQKKMISIG